MLRSSLSVSQLKNNIVIFSVCRLVTCHYIALGVNVVTLCQAVVGVAARHSALVDAASMNNALCVWGVRAVAGVPSVA